MGGGAKYSPLAPSVTSVDSGGAFEVYDKGSLRSVTRDNWCQVWDGENFEVESGGDIEVESGGDINLQSGGDIVFESGSSMKLGAAGAAAYPLVCQGISFTEDGSGTSYTGTVEIPAGVIVHDIGFVSTVLWDGTSATLDIGDDDDANGWFAGFNLKATDLAVGEVLSITNSENWGGKQGVYLVAASGRKGRTTAGVDSGVYYGAASEVIFLVTPGAADGSAGRSFGWVTYSIPTFVASTNV